MFKFHRNPDFTFPKELHGFIQEKKDEKGTLISVLHRVQSFYGYIPEKAALKLSQEMKVSLAKIYGIATFYHFFKLAKPGKIMIKVCLGTACYLKGSKDLLQELRTLLDIGTDELSTKDRLFFIETVRCVGCCGLAPVIVMGGDVYGSVTKDKLPDILAKYKAKEPV